MNIRKGLTLQELLIVVIVIGILAGVALTQYNQAVLRARIREVRTSLRLIQAAQKIYYTRNDFYLTSGDINEINRELGLDLETSYWDYITQGVVTPGVAYYPSRVNTDFYYQIGLTGDASCVAVTTPCPQE